VDGAPDVSRRDIERHFARSMFVAEVACVAWDPSSRHATLLVVPDRAVLRANGLTGVRELVRFEFETLAVQHRPPLPVPDAIFTFDPVPRTDAGEIDHQALGRPDQPHLVLRARRALDDTPASRLVTAALASLRPALMAGPIDADTNLELDLDLDSLARAALFAAVELRAGYPPTSSGATWEDVFTIGDLVARVERLGTRASSPSVGAEPPAPTPEGEAGDAGQGPRHGTADDATWQAVFSAVPTDDAIGTELQRQKWSQAVGFWLALRLLRLAVVPFVRIEVSGRHHLPASGPAVICPNHESFLDAFVVSAALPFRLLRQTFFLGATEYFVTPAMRRLARAINLVPVDPDGNLSRAMQLGALGLRRGKVLVVFPEGERSIDGTVRTFRDGTARLALATGSVMVPVATRGMFELWPRGFPLRWRSLRPWRRPHIRVAIGRPIQASPDRSVEDTTRVLRDTVITLWTSATDNTGQ
jgi:long-chain acyl-CoA synthetase